MRVLGRTKKDVDKDKDDKNVPKLESVEFWFIVIQSKRRFATRNLIRNKVADKSTSIGKSKEKKKTKKAEEIYIPPEKRQQVIDDLKLFSA